MPKATVSMEAERYDLKTAPPDGFIYLRPMSYGRKLHRSELATGDARMKQVKGSKDTELAMAILQRATAEYEFHHCVVSHNLTGDDDELLDFTKSATLDTLDPRIGDEISALIGKMNNYDEEDEDVEGKA